MLPGDLKALKRSYGFPREFADVSLVARSAKLRVFMRDSRASGGA